MTVELDVGTSARTVGRALASPSSPRAPSTRAIGTCRFHDADPAPAARSSATFEKRTACRRRRRSCHT